MPINFIDIGHQLNQIRASVDKRIATVLEHGKFIMGPEVKELEAELAKYCSVKHCISCANGTDALLLALWALDIGEGSAVFIPSFNFASAAEAVLTARATPVFVDVDPSTFNMCSESLTRSIEYCRTENLKPAAVIPTELFGLPADYTKLLPIAKENDLFIISDCAQSFGAQFEDSPTCSLVDISTTSFFPAKPLGCYGDGGAVFTNNDEWAEKLSSMCLHGKGEKKYDHVRLGMNSRLDTIQAAILLEKLNIYDAEIDKRQKIAERYNKHLEGFFETPTIVPQMQSVWAQYTLKVKESQDRDQIIKSLKQSGIPAMVYYPIPLHKQTAFLGSLSDPQGLPVSEMLSSKVFSLPFHPYLEYGTQDVIIDACQQISSHSV